MDTLHALRVAVVVHRTGGFSAAARELGVTPGAVAKLVAQLEARIGMRLFERSTRHVSPTRDALLLFERAEGPLRALVEVLESVPSARSLRGPIRVSVPAPLARMILLPGLGRFMERHPEIELDLRLENRRVALLEEGYDCAIGSPPGADSSLVARPLASLYPVLCASPGYLAAHGSPRELEDLARHRLIGLRSESTGRVRDWTLLVRGRPVSFRPSGVLQVTDPEALAAAAAEGCGIALVGFHHAARAMAEGRLVRVLPELNGPRFQIVIYYARRRHQPARVRAFVDHVIASMSDLAGFHEGQPAPGRSPPSGGRMSSTERSRG